MKHILKVLLVISLMECLVNAQDQSYKDNSENVCDGYCFKVLKPMLEHIKIVQKQWDECDGNKLANTQSRLDEIETEFKKQHDRDTSYENAIEETKQKLLKQTNLIEAIHKKTLTKPFQKFGAKYYYIEQKQKLNWFAAAHRCFEFGAHLINLNNQTELDELTPNLDSLKTYWTDVNDLSNEGEFLSLTTGLRAQFLYWNNNEPNNARGNEHCVHLIGKLMQMNDLNCDAQQYFICESFND